MFDVSWSEPTETVASHRSRKAHESSSSGTKTPNQRASLIITSESSSSSLQSPNRGLSSLGIFSSAKKDKRHAKSNTDSTRDRLGNQALAHRLSSSTNSTEDSEVAENEDFRKAGVRNLETFDTPIRSSTLTDASRSSESSNGSRSSHYLSPWSTNSSSCHSNPLEIATKHEFQPLSPHSFVIRSTNVTITTQDLATSLQQPMREVYITADVPNDLSLDIETERTPSSSPPKQHTSSTRANTKHTRRPERSKRPAPFTAPLVTKPWQPPSDWDCLISPTSPSYPRRRKRAPLVPTHIHHQIRRMAVASPKIIYERLNEEWTEVPDASFYKELEFEKQLWLLTALEFLQRGGLLKNVIDDEEDRPEPRVLSLYESKASYTYLKTFSQPPTLTTHHPTPASSTLPYPSSLFHTIKSLPLLTLLPAPSIPSLLRNCHRVLVPGGTLQLTLLDPRPIANTTGPCMTAWLKTHLLKNLEAKGLCKNLEKAVAMWLLDAGFTGGASGQRVSLRAVETLERSERSERLMETDGKRRDDKERGGNSREGRDAKDVSTEAREKAQDVEKLKVKTARMLWREIWGPWVVGEKWWWEDEEVLEECKALGTRWEVVFVKAVTRA